MLLRPKKNRRSRKVDVKAAAKAHAPRALKLLGLGVLIVAGGFGAQVAWAMAQVSPQFGLKVIEVRGNDRAATGELLKLAGLTEGQNLFQLDVPALERAVMTHPWVKTAVVVRHFPARVTIDVIEHDPAAVVSLGELYLVDRDGVPFKRLQPQDELDLTLITGLDRDAYTAHPLEARERITAALTVIEQWKPQPAEVRVSGLGFAVVQPDGLEVRLADTVVAPQLLRLAVVRRELQARKLTAEVIRLDNRTRPDWVTVQLSGGAPASPHTK